MAVVIQQHMQFDSALPLRKEAQVKSDRQALMMVASRLNSRDLNRNWYFGAFEAHKLYISANRFLKKPTGRKMFASTTVERATFFSRR